MSLPAAVQTVQAPAPQEAPEDAGAKRDWIQWYTDLSEDERRGLRNRVIAAHYDEVRDDAELRTFFLFHVEDLADAMPPGTRRIRELWAMTQTLRGRPEVAAERRRVVGHLLEAYQQHLVDNPWSV